MVIVLHSDTIAEITPSLDFGGLRDSSNPVHNGVAKPGDNDSNISYVCFAIRIIYVYNPFVAFPVWDI